jgi:hypothetical protein
MASTSTEYLARILKNNERDQAHMAKPVDSDALVDLIRSLTAHTS